MQTKSIGPSQAQSELNNIRLVIPYLYILMSRLKELWNILKKSVAAVSKDKIPKQSASLAYCTLFSLGPMLLVIIYLTNLFWSQQAAEGLIVQQLTGFIGSQAATQIH